MHVYFVVQWTEVMGFKKKYFQKFAKTYKMFLFFSYSV